MTQMDGSFISTMSQVSSHDTYSGYRGSSTVTGHSTSGHIYGRSIASDLESIPLHEGVGLQQLSLSPPLPKRQSSPIHHRHAPASSSGVRSSRLTGTSGREKRSSEVGADGSIVSSAPSESGTRSSTAAHRRKPYTDSREHDVCKYSFTVSGVTLALLETDPMHTHRTSAARSSPSSLPTFQGKSPSPPSSQSSPRTQTSSGLSSVDEGGLDPMKYFETVSLLLEEGINRKVLQHKQEELSQVLPNDHLL